MLSVNWLEMLWRYQCWGAYWPPYLNDQAPGRLWKMIKRLLLVATPGRGVANRRMKSMRMKKRRNRRQAVASPGRGVADLVVMKKKK